MSPHEEIAEYQLTYQLLKNLEESRLRFDKYIVDQKAKIDAQVMDYKVIMKKEQSQIDDLVINLEGVQSKRGLSENVEGIAQHHRDINSRRRQLEKRIEELSRNQEEKEKLVRELQDCELLHRGKAEEAREYKSKVEETKTTTIEDLTKGIVNYNYLGFTFVKAPNGLRFSFTKIDSGNPEKPFSFTLTANNSDTYVIHDCDLDKKVLKGLINRLNDTDDLSFFVLQMRRAFLDTIED